MGQHFTQSRQSRNLNLMLLGGIAEEDALRILRYARWPQTNGDPVCPYCGWKRCLVYRCRPIFKCRDCERQFSVTSGTIFHARKLTAVQTLYLVGRFVTNAKGVAAISMARETKLGPSSIFIFGHKLREAMASEVSEVILIDEVELDGMCTGKYVKPPNHRKGQAKRHRIPSRNRKFVCVLRQRRGRVLVKVVKEEKDVVPFVIARVDHNATVIADEAPGWNILGKTFHMERINHSECYSRDGVSTNLVESVHSRMRRMEEGIHHHISGPYIQLYAEENGWRENNSRVGDAEKFVKLLNLALNAPSSQAFRGYFQKKGARGNG